MFTRAMPHLLFALFYIISIASASLLSLGEPQQSVKYDLFTGAPTIRKITQHEMPQNIIPIE